MHIARKIFPPGRRIRVLVVDDSVVVRKILTTALSRDPDIEVVGYATNGRLALARIDQLKPDLITLDVEMPEMDGLETLRQIRRTDPNLVVIMCSTLTERGASTTLDALLYGANDYITKPTNSPSLENSIDTLGRELTRTIHQFFVLHRTAPSAAPLPTPAPAPSPVPAAAQQHAPAPRRHTEPPRVLAIGISTGGPAALSRILPQIPRDFPLPIVIVQHMPTVFTRLLAERLDQLSAIQVREAAPGDPLRPGAALVAPGDFHLLFRRSGSAVTAILDQSPPINFCRPAVDATFRSLADCYGGAVLAAILTGMGHDGTAGAELLRSKGARILAQDEASSVVWGMPGSVVRRGLADSVLGLDAFVPEILRITDLQPAGVRA